MLRYLIYAPLSLFMNLFVMATAWLWAIIPAVTKWEALPGWLRYLHTHDDDVYGSAMTGEAVPRSVFARWKRATWWMMRNPAYGFDTYVLGIEGPWKFDYNRYYYRIQGRRQSGFGYKRDLDLVGRLYLKIWLGWHDKPKGGSNRLMLKFSLGPKLKEKSNGRKEGKLEAR